MRGGLAQESIIEGEGNNLALLDKNLSLRGRAGQKKLKPSKIFVANQLYKAVIVHAKKCQGAPPLGWYLR